MAARLTLGIAAALRAVLIPGEAWQLMDRPLSWPRPFGSTARRHLHVVPDPQPAVPAPTQASLAG